MAVLETNKELAKQFFEQIWNQGDESANNRSIAKDAAGNDPKLALVVNPLDCNSVNGAKHFPILTLKLKRLLPKEISL